MTFEISLHGKGQITPLSVAAEHAEDNLTAETRVDFFYRDLFERRASVTRLETFAQHPHLFHEVLLNLSRMVPETAARLSRFGLCRSGLLMHCGKLCLQIGDALLTLFQTLSHAFVSRRSGGLGQRSPGRVGFLDGLDGLFLRQGKFFTQLKQLSHLLLIIPAGGEKKQAEKCYCPSERGNEDFF